MTRSGLAAAPWEQELRRAAAHSLATAGHARVFRVEVPAPGVDPLAWVAAQPDQKRGYWSDRDSEREVALIGEADEIKGGECPDFEGWSEAIARGLAQTEGDICYYGGFRFGPWHPSDLSWRPFGAYRFILPRVELIRRRGADTVAAVNVVRQPNGAWPDPLVPPLAAGPAKYSPPDLPRMLGRVSEPDDGQWVRVVALGLAAIREGHVSKVVLARRAVVRLSEPADPLALLYGIRRETGRCFQYGGCHGAGFAFVGASPERLYRRIGRRLDSEAVAGTRPRGDDPVEDQRFRSDLLASAKDAEEHRLVKDRIVRALAELSVSVEAESRAEVLQLGRVQHLRTPIRATLQAGATDAQLLARLHPTPATAGEPVAAAMEFLAAQEPFDRGWYAGPVGWVGRDAAEFAVALRCGLVVQSNLILYAGAGIVPGSEALAEAGEIETKLAPFIRLLHTT